MHNFVPRAQDKAGQWLKLVYPVTQRQIGMEHDHTPPEKISARQHQPTNKLIQKYHIEIAICKKEVAGKIMARDRLDKSGFGVIDCMLAA